MSYSLIINSTPLLKSLYQSKFFSFEVSAIVIKDGYAPIAAKSLSAIAIDL